MTPESHLDALAMVVRSRLPRGGAASSAARAERFFEDRVVSSATLGDFDLATPSAWDTVTDRTSARFLHGFLFMADWPEYIRTSEDPAGRVAEAYALTRAWAASQPYGEAHSMAFHDETTAQRLTNHLALLDEFTTHLDPEDLVWLRGFLDRTADLLSSDSFHSAGNNHGMFQDLALMSYAGLADWQPGGVRARHFETSARRLRDYFTACFTAEGVHVENTPTYHVLVARYVRDHRDLLRTMGHPDAETFDRLLARATRYATHAVMPNGVYPPISDTQQTRLDTTAADVFRDDGFTYAATRGAAGRRPAERVLVLPDSGYAVYRSAWGDENATFAYFHAAYNADYHKHSDDNSFFLRSGGLDLISEAGPYGYNYTDPMTRFAFSQYAHNTVVVDGASVPRTDDRAGTVRLEAHDVRDDGFSVSGRTGRLRGATHERRVDVVEVDASPRFTITDTLASDGPRDFELLWNLGPEVTPVVHGHGFELYHRGRKMLDAHFTGDVSLRTTLHRGEQRPHLGWRFPAFGAAEPANVVVVRFSGSRCRITTDIRLADFAYGDRGLGAVDSPWRRFQGKVGLNYLRVPAKTPAGARRLVVVFTAMHVPGDFTYNYKSTVDQTDYEALYILDDFGDQGAYYLQDHGDRAIFDTVQDLLRRTTADLGIGPDAVVMAGSSKGGAAAIAHGLAAGAGDVYVGAPQTRIGQFIAGPHPRMLQLMAGGTTEAHVAELDRVLFDIASAARPAATRIGLVVGDRDHHHENHAVPFVDHLRGLGFGVDLTVLPNLTHADIGGVYRRALLAHLRSLPQPGDAPGGATAEPVDSGTTPAEPVGTATHGRGSVQATVLAAAPGEYAFHLYREREVVAKVPYSERTEAAWEPLPPGRYRVRVYHRRDGDSPSAASTTNWVTVAGR